MFDSKVHKIPCAAHKLNLCVNDLFRVKKITENKNKFFIYDYNEDGDLRKKEISSTEKLSIKFTNEVKSKVLNILKKCKSLVGSFKHSEKLTRQLRETQKKLKYSVSIKLVQDVSTRWGSTHDLINSILVNKSALLAMSLLPENQLVALNLPNETEFQLLSELCDILEPLKEVTTVLSAQNNVVVTHLYPTIYSLINQTFNNMAFKTTEIQTLKEQLVNSMKKRFVYLLNSDLFKAITFLDNDYKNFEFIQNLDVRTQTLAEAKNFSRFL